MGRRLMKKLCLLLLGLALIPLDAGAQEAPWWQFWRSRAAQDDPGTGTNTSTSTTEPVRQSPNLLFSEQERVRLRDYLRATRNADSDIGAVEQSDDDRDDDKGKGKGKGKDKKNKQKPLPPGLQKKLQRGGQLPPGWQKKVERGEVIDAELYSQSQPLPSSVQANVYDPEGTETRLIGDRAFRVMRRTREILDVLNP